MRSKLEKLFPRGKPVLGMLHLGGATPQERLARALAETGDMVAGGVDAIVVENYFGDPDDARRVLEAFEKNAPGIVVGLNLLRDFRLGFDFVGRFKVSFLQIDSVCGHLPPDEDADYAAELAERRAKTDALLFGGVRFKYQPVKSGRSDEEDIRLGAARADALVVTGEATGQGTDNGKILRFRSVVGPDYPLIVGAGMTAATAADQMRIADGAIVGSYFKESYKDTGIVDIGHVRELMEEVRKVRAEGSR
ncbi:BtpA/SgcQ family protein [Mesorhizobium sp. BAC0120]|uniref:BtpA/SgcQ family protein n=1 Tax=Mesorhizobium sp. BAC0120 TaxID=3090670 RepID=UPI00298CBC5C|nr:BtpA/SgcQ family protein [Mesorhizobium sp. BAC0120]MDW6023244.1 BtpA/SgcQ family protein [Mesorhizobium sp. BAC0120]